MAILNSSLSVGADKSFLSQEKPKAKFTPSQAIPQLFKERHVAAACRLKEYYALPREKIRMLTGIMGGDLLGNLIETTGPAVAVHEFVGHALLGMEMTNRYAPGQGPTYQVDGWDNFQAIGKAGSFQDGLIAVLNWLSGYDTYGDGASGKTYWGHPLGPNPIGKAMGPDGQSAWISIAGSLPMLAIDTLSAVGGVLLSRRSPTIGSMLATMGIVNSLGNSAYPISAALMSPAELQRPALAGHDFANFANHMSPLLGMSAEAVAIATAAIWTPIVPLAALAAYLHTRSHAANIVPAALAVKHWLQKGETDPKIAKELERLFHTFRDKKELEEICQKVLASDGDLLTGDAIEQMQDIAYRFIAHILDRLPSASLDSAKMEVLAEWEKNVKPDRLQTALTVTALLGSAAAVATKVMQVFADTITPSLLPAVTALTYASPIFAGVSTLSAGYQVYKDFKCPDTIVPKSAKILSVARLVASVACAVLITAALFAPGLNAVFFGALILGSILNIILSLARSSIVQRRFELMQALKPEVSNVMQALWLNHQRKPAGAKMSRALKTWVNCVKRDPNFKFPAMEPSRELQNSISA